MYLCFQYDIHKRRFIRQAISNALKVLTSSGVYNKVTLHGTVFHKETPQMKNRNGTRSNVEHVKFGVVNKIIKNIIYRKRHIREKKKEIY